MNHEETRPLVLLTWALVGAVVGYTATGTGGAVVCMLVFALLGLAWLAVRPAVDHRPTRAVYAIPPAAAAVTVGVAALLYVVDYQLAGWVVIGLGLLAAPLLGRRAHSWAQAGVLAVGALVLAFVVALFVFLIDVGAHGGFD